MRIARFLLILLLTQVVPGLAQATVRVPEELQCSRCRVAVDTAVVLGERNGPGALPGEPAAVRVDALGRYWLVGADLGVLVFEATGGSSRRVGRRGRGPGEFEYPADVVPITGDSVLLLDGNRRATVLTPDLRPARTTALPSGLAPAIALEWPGRVVANGIVHTPEGAGWPLHHVSFTSTPAAVVASFGPERGELRPDRESWLLQSVASAQGGGLWSADRVRFRLHEWDHNLRHLRTLERAAPWFDRPSMHWIGNKSTPPPPLVVGIGQDSSRIIWAVIHRAASNWRLAWPNYPEGAKELPNLSIAVERLYEVVVEAIDAAGGRVLARTTFPGYAVSALPGGGAALYDTSAEGVPTITIVRFRLVR